MMDLVNWKEAFRRRFRLKYPSPGCEFTYLETKVVWNDYCKVFSGGGNFYLRDVPGDTILRIETDGSLSPVHCSREELTQSRDGRYLFCYWDPSLPVFDLVTATPSPLNQLPDEYHYEDCKYSYSYPQMLGLTTPHLFCRNIQGWLETETKSLGALVSSSPDPLPTSPDPWGYCYRDIFYSRLNPTLVPSRSSECFVGGMHFVRTARATWCRVLTRVPRSPGAPGSGVLGSLGFFKVPLLPGFRVLGVTVRESRIQFALKKDGKV